MFRISSSYIQSLFYLWCDTGWHKYAISQHGCWRQRIHHNVAPHSWSKLPSSMSQTPVGGVGALNSRSTQCYTHYTHLHTVGRASMSMWVSAWTKTSEKEREKTSHLTCPGWRGGTDTSLQRSPGPTTRFPHMNFSCRKWIEYQINTHYFIWYFFS